MGTRSQAPAWECSIPGGSSLLPDLQKHGAPVRNGRLEPPRQGRSQAGALTCGHILPTGFLNFRLVLNSLSSSIGCCRHFWRFSPVPCNIRDEFATIDLGDQRRDERLLHLAARLTEDPTRSVRASFKGEAEIKAGFRLLHNEHLSMEQILGAHRQAALLRASKLDPDEALLFIQDTTELDFTTHKALQGAGPLSDLSLRGFHVQNHLLASEVSGLALGLCSAKAWAREDEHYGKAKKRNRRPLEQKESFRWVEGYEEACKLAAELASRQIIMVADRECDIFAIYGQWSQSREAGKPCADFIVRAMHDRNLSPDGSLFETLKEAPLLGTYEVEVDQKRQRIKVKGNSRSHVRMARTAKLEVRSLEVNLIGPQYAKGLKSVKVSAVLVEETHPPEGQSPIRWFLLTSLRVENFQQAMRVVRCYTRRWLVEDFHRILKSGCRVEAIRLRESAAMLRAVALYMVIAWRILYLRDLSRTCPQVPASWFFTEAEQRAAALIFRLPQSKYPSTLKELCILVAKIGGYAARKNDPPPGAECMWRGMEKLRCYVEMGEALGAF